MKAFTGRYFKVLYRQVDEAFSEDFRDYLKISATIKANKPLTSKEILAYFNKFRATLNKVQKDKNIQYNSCLDIKNPK